ncbi:MAG: TIGR04283 family arsenosugar biosynthesis glycosyltransferase [Pseudomonadota bacterium]
MSSLQKEPEPMSIPLSIIIPVYNESDIINDTLQQLLSRHFYFPFEIIVVDGDPKGTTIASISFLHIIKIIGKKGRGSQMNAGARLAKGDVLLFLHADTLLDSGAFEKIMSVMNHPQVSAGAFQLGIRSGKTAYRIIEKAVTFRTRFSKIPYGDQGIFVRKKTFFQMGGFKDISIMEDVDLMRRLKRSKRKIVLLSEKAYTSSRRWEKEGILYCTLRNWALISLYLLGLPPSRLARFYRSRRSRLAEKIE